MRSTQNEADNTAKRMESAGNKAAQFFSKLKENATEFLAVFTAGKSFKEFLTDVTQADAQVGRLAYSIDASVKELGAWQNAAKMTGGSAEATTNSLVGLNRALNQAILTGTLPQFVAQFRAMGISIGDQYGKIRNVTDLMFQLNRAVQGMDPARASALLSGVGLDQGTVNMLLMRPDQFKKTFDTGEGLAASDKDVKAAQDRQAEWEKLLLKWNQVGRDLVTDLTPALLKLDEFLNRLADWAESHPNEVRDIFLGIAGAVGVMSLALTIGGISALMGVAGALTATATAGEGLLGVLGRLALVPAIGAAVGGAVGGSSGASGGFWGSLGSIIPGALGRLAGPLGFYFGSTSGLNAGEDEQARRRRFNIPIGPLGSAAPGAPGGTAPGSTGTEAMIRQIFGAQGIDPDTAVAVARSEGLNTYTGDAGSSFGPFQLHYGGVASGGNSVSGLGDDFTRDTGLDARDPSTVRQQLEWTAGYVRRHGWGAFHGAARVGIGRRQGLGAGVPPPGAAIGAPGAAVINNSSSSSPNNSSSTTINGGVTIKTSSNDGQGIARDFMGTISNNTWASQANSSLV